MPPRSQLVCRLRGWLAEGPPEHLKLLPLLPTFSARVIYALRGALAMGITSAFMLSPASKDLLRGSILVPVAAVISVQLTIGATLLTAWRLIIAAAVATAYNSAYIAIFGTSPSIPVALAALALMSFVVSYLDVTTAFKRFALGAGAVVIAPSWDANRLVNYRLAVDVGLGIALGAAAGVIIAAVPLPAPATATREVSSRLRLLYMACRNELAALAVTFTHEAAAPASTPVGTSAAEGFPGHGDGAAAATGGIAGRAPAMRHKLSLFPELDEGGSATPGASLGSASTSIGPSGTAAAARADGSTSDAAEITRQFSLSLAAEDCPFDVDGGVHASVAAAAAARSPLLRADIDDMHLFATQQAGLLNRAAGEIPYEPLQLLAWCMPRTGRALRRFFQCLCTPFRWLCCTCRSCRSCGKAAAASSRTCCKSSESGISGGLSALPEPPERAMRLLTWTKAQAKLHRILQALVVAERQVPVSPLHSLFLVELRQPLCRLVLDVVRLYGVGLSWSSRIRWRPSACAASCCGDGGGNGSCSACGCGCAAAGGRGGDGTCAFDCWVPPCGYPHEAGVSLADVKQARADVETSLTAFFDAFLRTRVRLFYSPGTPLRLSPIANRTATAAESSGLGAVPSLGGNATSQISKVPVAYTVGGNSHGGNGSSSSSPAAGGQGGGPKLTAWHLADSFPITTVLFMVLRYAQVVLSTVDSTCGLTPAVSVAAATAPLSRAVVPSSTAAAASTSTSRADEAGASKTASLGVHAARTLRLQSAADTWLPGSGEEGSVVARGKFAAAAAPAATAEEVPVKVTTAATASSAPGEVAALEYGRGASAVPQPQRQPQPQSNCKACCTRACCRASCTWLVAWPVALWLWLCHYIGLRWTWRQFTRAARIAIAMTAAMGLGIVFQEYIFPSGPFGYWAVSSCAGSAGCRALRAAVPYVHGVALPYAPYE